MFLSIWNDLSVREQSKRSKGFHSVADPEMLKWGSGIQCISPVVIYRKCTQLDVFYMGKGGLLKNNSEPIGGRTLISTF